MAQGDDLRHSACFPRLTSARRSSRAFRESDRITTCLRRLSESEIEHCLGKISGGFLRQIVAHAF